MTAATYVSDLSDIFLFENNTGVSAYGGGGAGLGAGPDFAMEGTNANDKQVTAADKGLMFDAVTNFTIGADDHFFIWILGATPGLNDTRDNHGVHAAIGDDTSNFVKFHVDGSDTLPLGGGKVYPIRFVNTTLTNLRTLVGTPGTTPSFIGGGLNTTASVMGVNLGVDGARIGTGYDILNGTGADPEADFAGIASDDEGTSEGIFQTGVGGFNLQGKLRIGSGATACEFLDSNTNIFLLDTIHSLTDFTEILIENSASIVTLTNVNFIGLGTNNLGRLEAITSAATLAFTGCGFIDFGVTILGTGSTMTTCRWINAGIVTANGANLAGSSISGFEGTANTSGLIWDVATNPSTAMTDMTFTKGAASTHAIEFGLTSPLAMTLTGVNFNGYNASDGNDDSAIHFKRTTGTINLTISGGSTPSFRTDGATVNILSDVTVTFDELKDNSEVRVFNASTGVELAGIEDATAGSVDDRNFAASIPASTVVNYVIHNFQDDVPIYKTIRKENFTWPTTDQTIIISQVIDRNVS